MIQRASSRAYRRSAFPPTSSPIRDTYSIGASIKRVRARNASIVDRRGDFGLTGVFSYINERFLKPRQTIGLMLLALGLTLGLMLLNRPGRSESFAQDQAFVARLSLDAPC